MSPTLPLLGNQSGPLACGRPAGAEALALERDRDRRSGRVPGIADGTRDGAL